MAEELAAVHMHWLGYLDARRTAVGADKGLDVVASGAVAQVKHHAQAVAAPVVQQLLGAAYGHDRALFYSSSGFTRQATEYANSAGVALFSIDPAMNVVAPANELAASLCSERTDPDELASRRLDLARTGLALATWHRTMERVLAMPGGAVANAAALVGLKNFLTHALALQNQAVALLTDLYNSQGNDLDDLDARIRGLQHSLQDVRPSLERADATLLLEESRAALDELVIGHHARGATYVRLLGNDEAMRISL